MKAGLRTFTMIALALGSVAAVAAPAKKAAPARKAAPADAPSAEIKQLLDNCDAHKFETTVDTVEDGQPHRSKVKLCGKEGQSDADWIGTLKDAIAKLDANKDMDAGVRTQIETAINAEIARLQSAAASKPAVLANDPGFGKDAATPSTEYSSLPPLPAAPPPPPKVLVPAETAVATAVPATRVARVPAASIATVPTGPAPKLSYSCYSPGDLGGDAPCAGFDRQTMLTVRAQADVPAGLELRFLRNGEQRAQVDLAQLHRGKSLRIALPNAVCAGVGDGSLQLQVVQNGAEVKSDGPYSLRC
jgi:hypothetical protein